MSKKLHAERNERLCRKLRKDGDYLDWVVTTSFYSALHFVQNEIFPLDNGARKYTNFENYYNSHTFVGKRPSKHKATIDLTFEHLGDAGESYEWLHDTCITARYHRYNIPEAIADKAIEHLEIVKGYCVK